MNEPGPDDARTLPLPRAPRPDRTRPVDRSDGRATSRSGPLRDGSPHRQGAHGRVEDAHADKTYADGADTEHGHPPRGRAAKAVGRGAVRGAALLGRGSAGFGRGSYRLARRASQAQGAGETGLSRLIEVHAFSSAGDAAVTVGLAGTVFFAGSSSQARGHTLLFLLLTMLPFAVVAPLMGPLLDRFRHGRRWAIGATLAGRAFLCWVLAQAVDADSLLLFPVAMSVLVASKAYLVTRSAAAPRLLPSQLTLVKANGRLSLAGVVGAAIGGGIAGLATKLGGPAWSLRVAFVLFIVGTVLAVLLSPRVDSSEGEKPASMVDLATGENVVRRGVSHDVVLALRANVGLRWLSGFLTIFLAFLMRSHPFPGWEHRTNLLLALVVGAAGVGNALGTVMGSLLKFAAPRVIVLVTLLADAVAIVAAAVFFGLRAAVLVGLIAGIGQQLGKLALDSLIQDTVPEHMRTSVFGRSETLLQLSWVVGGIVAVVIPNNATVGMVLAATVLLLWVTAVLIWRSGRDLPRVSLGRAGRRT
ncbi:MFS transporter [Allobranchiibius sp. GilTou73]|uniref:MFS transporter n=1 Tax=Allobranchiibius sp. GilTou73 TaxID=2904523 RepID=UPI001F1C2467|nr:MFS transporter [Allobranchiibius sp. GilTou73]UIJ33645.1 MFS transporter [Allobranchiibius sp. GilTou73]